MKELIFHLFCFFSCKFSSCNKQPDWLTDQGTIEIFGTTNDSAPSHEINKIRIVNGRVKREARDVWRMTVGRGDRSILTLNCIQTDGILMDRDTPVWRAERSNTSDEALKELGEFDFCLNFENKGAAALFHDLKIADVFFGDNHVTFGIFDSADSSELVHENSSVPESQSSDTSGIPIASIVKRDAEKGPLRSDPPPATVYPQLLIQLDAADVRRNLPVALIRMMSYWNAVDMLYSDLEQPRIKLNIVGLIAPADNYSTPWITKAKFPDHDRFVNKTIAMFELGQHFQNYSHIFPDDNYDFMLSFVSDQLGAKMSHLGVSNVINDCSIRSHRVASIRNYLGRYTIGAHELAHLKMETQCLSNCPRTRPNCDKDPTPVDTGVSEGISNITTELPNFSCVRHLVEICQQTPWPLFTERIACNDNMICTRDGVENDICSRSPFSPTKMAICQHIEYPIMPQDGIICERNESSPISSCYRGRCVPIDRNTPRCAGVNSDIQFKIESHSM